MTWVQVCMLTTLLVCLAHDGRGQSAEVERSDTAVEYYYRFESPNLEMARAELRFDASRQGQFVFRRKSDEEEITLDVHVLPETIERINQYLAEAQFLTSQENYQAERDMSHLGTTTIRVRHGAQQRQVSFNYTRHPAMRALAELLRHMVTQESRVFAIQLARQYEPLDLDRQLLALQREVKNGWVAEPRKLLPLLEDLQSDEGVLLMARRHAGEIIRLIKKR